MPPDVAAVVERQDGVVSRAQLLGLGCTRGWIAHRLRRGSWRVLHPGVYVTHTGPLTHSALVWAALLHAGPGALASHRTAAHLQGLLDEPPQLVEVSVPFQHRTTTRPGLLVRRRRLSGLRRPGGSIPQTKVDQTVLDLVDVAQADEDAVGWLMRACQRRLTTPARLEVAAAQRPRLRHRALVLQVLADVADGAQSPLERRYARDVERAHGLPAGSRNGRQVVRGRVRLADVRYGRWRTTVELDGLAYHPVDARHHDAARDNLSVLAGDVVLRYGWREVVGSPCEVARQVADVLAGRGWPGRVGRCSAECSASVRRRG